MDMSDSDSSCSSRSHSSLNDFSDIENTQPYLFEPYDSQASSERESNDNSDSEHEVNNSRLQNTDWCRCDNCQRLDREVECICCQEIDCIVAKNNEAVERGAMAVPPSCITQHPGFLANCLNIWVLQSSWLQYKSQYGKNAYDGPEHKKNRHVAYRQLVRWCWGFIGKDIRVTLPSCAVCCIRAHFPPPGIEDNFEFVGFRYADE